MQVTSVNPDHSELSSVKSEGIKQEVTQLHSIHFVCRDDDDDDDDDDDASVRVSG